MHIQHQIIGHLQLLRRVEQLVLLQRCQPRNLLVHLAHMTYCLHHVAGTRLTLRANHRSTLVDTAQRLAQILRTADKRHSKFCFINMVYIVSRREHLALINIVNLQRLQNLRLNEMTNTHLSHNRDRYSVLNLLNQLRVAHACHAAGSTDIRRNLLQRHNCAGTCSLSNFCLLGIGYVHDNAALKHLGKLSI